MSDEKLEILREISERQKESLKLQREQFEFIKGHYDRAEVLQEKAEKLQDRASGLFKVIFPIILALIGFLIYILYSYF